jgi:Ca2+/Na+ antiporter
MNARDQELYTFQEQRTVPLLTFAKTKNGLLALVGFVFVFILLTNSFIIGTIMGLVCFYVYYKVDSPRYPKTIPTRIDNYIAMKREGKTKKGKRK